MVVIVVVALLLTNFLIVVYFVHPAFNPPDDEGEVIEPDEEEPWLLPAEPENISVNDKRDDWTGTLDRPVVITDGANVVIQDSHIRVYLEDLMFWLRPAFQVEPGSTLHISNTTIEIYQDPRLEASVFGPYQRPDHNIPYITRVVNLENAVDPVLNMDVQWLGNATPLAVGVLPSNNEDLVLLDTFSPTTSAPHTWSHFEVGLSDYIGTQPWVVIWFNIYPEYPVLIGNLTVMDGEGWPEGDAFPTGHPEKDGWATSRFVDLPDIQRTDFKPHYMKGLNDVWQPLIEAQGGDVTLFGSQVVAPSGLDHRTRPDLYKESIDPDQMFTIDQVGSRGGHITITEGILDIFDSTITNVPVAGHNASVALTLSTFSGEADLVSLHRPDGSVSRCTFITEDLPWSHRYNELHHRYIWALGVEGASPDGPLSVDQCVFEGSKMALEVSRADIMLSRSVFRHISGLAIWDHLSEGLGDWEFIERHNTFRDMGQRTYLRSSITDVFFLHPERNESDIRVTSGTSISHDLELPSPFSGKLKSFHGNQVRYIVPEILVLRTGEVQTSPGIGARITWESESERFAIPPGTESMTIDLQELFCETVPDPGMYAPMDLGSFEPGEGPDVYQIQIAISDTRGLRVLDPTMRFQVNGETVAEVNITEEDLFGDLADPTLMIWQNLTLPPGWRDMNVTVRGRAWLEGDNYTVDPVEVDHLSLPMLMMAEDVEFEPWMPLAAHHIIVPEGVSASIASLAPREDMGKEHRIEFRAWNGSRVSVDCSDLPLETRLGIEVPSDLTIEVTNATVRMLNLGYPWYYEWESINPGHITLRDIVADSFYMSALGRNVTVSDINVKDNLIIRTYHDSNLTVADSTFHGASTWIDMTDGTLVIENCSFSSNWSRGMLLDPELANVTIVDCTFTDTHLLLFFDNWYWTASRNINITGCRFSGEEAVLYIGWDINRIDSYDVDAGFVPLVNGSVEGNTFSGPDCHVVLGHGLFGQLWGDNELEEGARLHAFYITRLQVIPPDGTPFWGAYDFFPREGFITDWPFQIFRWVEMDGEIMWDVTDDPSVENDPPTLEVHLYSKYGSGRIVRGFWSVVPNADNDEATYPVFPEVYRLLKDHLIHWPPLDDRD